MSQQQCFSCRAPLKSDRGFVFCESCGAPQFPGDSASPFALFGLEPSFTLEQSALEDTYYGLSKQLHPDRFTTAAPAVRIKAQELSALLNQAYQALRNPENRLETLLRRAGALKDSEKTASQNQIPAELAEEYFELQEAVMEDPQSAGKLASALREKLNQQNEKLSARMFEKAGKIDWSSPASGDMDEVIKLRRERSYVRSMLENLERLGV